MSFADLNNKINDHFSEVILDMSGMVDKEAAVNGRRASWPPGLQYNREQFRLDTSDLNQTEQMHLRMHWNTPASSADAQKLFRAFADKYRACSDLLGRDGDCSAHMQDKLLEQGLVMTWAMQRWLSWTLSQLHKENFYYEQKVCEVLNSIFGMLVTRRAPPLVG